MGAREFLGMPLEEAISTQRAIRRFKLEPVDDDLVLHLIELALKAPTGGNAQNWEFIIVKDAQVKARLAGQAATALGRLLGLAALAQPRLRISFGPENRPCCSGQQPERAHRSPCRAAFSGVRR